MLWTQRFLTLLNDVRNVLLPEYNFNIQIILEESNIIESEIVANCNVCHEDKKIIHIDKPFREYCSFSNCISTMCKDCFHVVIKMEKLGVY